MEEGIPLKIPRSMLSYQAPTNPPRGSSFGKITISDVVLIHEDSRSRELWKIAKVESLVQVTDDKVRGAVVKVPSSKSQPTLLRRPLQLLYPLEVQQCFDDIVQILMQNNVEMTPLEMVLTIQPLTINPTLNHSRNVDPDVLPLGTRERSSESKRRTLEFTVKLNWY